MVKSFLDSFWNKFSKKYLFSVVPKTVKKIAVLDRTKEPGASDPLYLDIRNAFYDSELKPEIVGGRYGLSSKNTGPSHILSAVSYTHLTLPTTERV